MRLNRVKLTLFSFWIMLIAIVAYQFLKSGIPLHEYPNHIRQIILRFGRFSPLIYILIYIVRPLVFFPATLLTAASGAVFGPIQGILFTMIGENLSANFTFLIGRYFGKDFVRQMTSQKKIVNQIDCKIGENGFFSVLIMRLVYLPFDLVGYISGASKISQIEYALGTFIGILPGMVLFVLLGSSITDPRNLIFSLIILVFGIVFSQYLKRKKLANPPRESSD